MIKQVLAWTILVLAAAALLTVFVASAIEEPTMLLGPGMLGAAMAIAWAIITVVER